MTTVVQQPSEGSNGMGFVLGIIILVVFLGLLFFYGLPMLNRQTSAPQINVPEKVDVNVNQ